MQVQAGEAALQQVLQRADLTGEQLPWDETFAVLDNDQRPADVEVPRTGALCHQQFDGSDLHIAASRAVPHAPKSFSVANFAWHSVRVLSTVAKPAHLAWQFADQYNAKGKRFRCMACAGVDWDMDLWCSSIFVPITQRNGLFYGTRSQTIAAVWASGKIEVQERSLSEDGATWQRTSLTSSLKRAGKPDGA